VAIFDENMEQMTIKGIVIDDVDSVTKVNAIINGKVSGVLINANGYGYTKVRFDLKSLQTFEDNLYKI
jgi:hypothetical protein